MGNCGGKNSDVKKDMEEEGLPSALTVEKKEELQAVLDADTIKLEEDDAWYIVEAAWVQRWHSYMQAGDSAKKPGPIKNETLLMHDKAADAWVPRQLLRAAGREHMGHYRRVNPHVWNIWTDLYHGSGPALWVKTEPFEDSSNWQLDAEFDGVVRGRRGGGGGGNQAARQGQQEAGGGGAGGDEARRQKPDTSLAIGEMEDSGVGEETAAQAAAFFDVTLDSPRTSAAAAAAAAAAAEGEGEGNAALAGGASGYRNGGNTSSGNKRGGGRTGAGG
ncbi:unnamed protein product [Pylaiella littoralis]